MQGHFGHLTWCLLPYGVKTLYGGPPPQPMWQEGSDLSCSSRTVLGGTCFPPQGSATPAPVLSPTEAQGSPGGQRTRLRGVRGELGGQRRAVPPLERVRLQSQGLLMENSLVQGDPLLGGRWQVPIGPMSCPTAPRATLNPIAELVHRRGGQ